MAICVLFSFEVIFFLMMGGTGDCSAFPCFFWGGGVSPDQRGIRTDK